MHADRRDQLLKKREQLQLQIRFNDFEQCRIAPFFAILQELQRLQIDFTILAFRCVPKEFHELLREYVRHESLSTYSSTEIPITGEDFVVETALEKYPSSNPFRYVLDAPVVGYADDPSEVWAELMDIHQFYHEKVYLCWLQYAFLLEVDLRFLARKATEDLFSPSDGDAIIFPSDLSWLVAYSDKDEWRFGKLGSNSHHSP